MRVTIRFGGMRDLAIFAVIFGICAENRGGERKLQIRAEAGFLFLCVDSRRDMRFGRGIERDLRQLRSQGPLSTSRKYPGYGWSRVC